MITTFYADRADISRPALLARVATQLAGWGHRVLCVDWDLSGDGVSGVLGAPPVDRGLVDLVRDGGDTRLPEAFAATLPPRRWSGTLDLIQPYGQRSFPGPVDWVSLHRRRDLGDYLESCAELWRQEYDAVLIDAPSGTGPAAGICLAHLPDALVPLVPPDRQQDTAALLDRVAAVRDRLPYDRGRLLTIPWLTEGWLAPELAATPDTTDRYVRRAAAGSPRAAERLAAARRAAREALETVLFAILPAEEWAGLERSVLALKNTLDTGDPSAIAAAIRDLPVPGAQVRGPRGIAIPDDLRATVSGLLRRL